MSELNKLLDTILDVPIHNIDGADRSHIDESMLPKIKAVKDLSIEDRPAAMEEIINECAHNSLASSFAMKLFNIVLDLMKKERDKK